jgi:hypothetical protein
MLMQSFGRHLTMAGPERDSDVSRRYRELAREEPPRALDTEILAAADRELESRAAPLVAPTARRRWYVPLAAAAVIVLSVVVTLALQRAQEDPELQWQEETPATPKAAAVPEAEGQADPKPTEVLPPAAPAARQITPGIRAERPASPAPPLDSDTRTQPQVPSAEGNSVRRSSAESTVAPLRDELSPEDWLRQIADLRREGRQAEADAQYAAFRRRYPQYPIPQALREQVLPR